MSFLPCVDFCFVLTLKHSSLSAFVRIFLWITLLDFVWQKHLLIDNCFDLPPFVMPTTGGIAIKAFAFPKGLAHRKRPVTVFQISISCFGSVTVLLQFTNFGYGLHRVKNHGFGFG